MMKMCHLFAILLLISLPTTAILGYTYIHPKPFQGTIRELDFGTTDNSVTVKDKEKLKKVCIMLDELELTMKFPQNSELEDPLKLRIVYRDRSYIVGLAEEQIMIDGKVYQTDKDIKPNLLDLVME